jgi:hypothetical protein
MAWPQVVVGALKTAAKNKTVQKSAAAAATKASSAFSKRGVEGAKRAGSKRKCRRLAIDTASQIGGKYSEGTVVDGERRYVVWKDGKPMQAFPHFEGELAERWELKDFPESRLMTPPSNGGGS